MSRKSGAKDSKKQQAASLARRMAGKKGMMTQLQAEITNEEEWEKLLTREGLIVVDVYSDWSGPCLGMIGNLRKVKVEVGGDSLHLATAKNDEIEALKRFRNKSEPTWMFIAGGQLITVTFGANAPKLMRMIENEVRHEMRVLRGETWRHGIPFEELCEEEKERAEAHEKMKLETERLEAERTERQRTEKRLKIYQQMSEHLCNETVVVCLPHTIHPDFGCVMATDLDLFWRSQMVYVASSTKMNITVDLLKEIFFREAFEFDADVAEALDLGPCLVLLLKSQIIVNPGQEGEKKPGDIEKQIFEGLFMVKCNPDADFITPETPNYSIPGKFPYIRKIRNPDKLEIDEEEDNLSEDYFEEVTNVPGCWTPTSYLTKCAAVRYLFPARAEKVMVIDDQPSPPKLVIAFDVAKHKECYEVAEEFEKEVLNVGFFSGLDPTTAEHLCANPEQYAIIEHSETDKLVFVITKNKSEPLLSFAGLGACYVSADEKAGPAEADLFFPPDEVPRFPRVEEALLMQKKEVEEEMLEEEEEEEEESIEQDEDDLMALLGIE